MFTLAELDAIAAALAVQLRYFQNGLDRAKEDDAVNNWARRCVQTKALIDKNAELRRAA